MFERFTDRARKVMALANQEAQRFNHEYIGTEHILLGLVKEGSGVGANVLKNLDVDLRKVQIEVEKLIKCGQGNVMTEELPLTPRVHHFLVFGLLLQFQDVLREELERAVEIRLDRADRPGARRQVVHRAMKIGRVRR